MTEEGIRDILAAFETVGSYKREEVQAAIEIQDQITPYLMEIVEKVASTPRNTPTTPATLLTFTPSCSWGISGNRDHTVPSSN